MKGGVAAASLRASIALRRCLGNATDLLVAFDAAALEQNVGALAPLSYVIFDSAASSRRPRAPRSPTRG